MKNILIANSWPGKNSTLLDIFNELSVRYSFSLWTGSDHWLAASAAAGEKRKMWFGPSVFGAGAALFFLFWPVLSVVYFFLLAIRKTKKLEMVVCFGEKEKMLLSLPARILGMAVLWLEVPGERRPSLALKTLSPLAKVAAFTEAGAGGLAERGFDKKNICNVSLSASQRICGRQENIFNGLARADKPHSFFKSFTIGTVVGREEKPQLETLLKIAKICSGIIPNLRLVAIGVTGDRRHLNWLAQKMGLEKKVWFVGEQEDLGKWLEDFDLYLFVGRSAELFDLEAILAAMSRGLPIVSWAEKNASEAVLDGYNGFFTPVGEVDSLAQKIVDIEPDQALLARIGANGRLLFKERFAREDNLARLAQLLG